MGGRLGGWWFGECRSKARLDGKLAIITGCNTGIGKETAKDFVRRGCRVIMACRDLEKANLAAKEVMQEISGTEQYRSKEMMENDTVKGKSKVEVYQLDLNSLDSVRQFAQKILTAEPEINLLINNAGIMACPKAQTKDGYELQLGVNHLGHFLLTCLLIQRICASKEPRIINVSSIAHKWGDFDFDDMNLEKSTYSPTSAYSRSKLANVLFTKELSRRLEGTGVNAYALHPGVVATELGRHLDSTLLPGMSWIWRNVGSVVAKSPVQGAQTTIYCAVDEKAGKETGLYYSDCKVKRPSAKARDPVMARRLWEESLKMVGLKEDPTLNLPQKARTLIPEVPGQWDSNGCKQEEEMDSLWGRRRGGANRRDGEVAGERTPGRRRRKVGRQRVCILVTTALTGAALLAILASMLIMVNGESTKARVLQVHVVFRHGDRTPTSTYPNDPYRYEENWPEGWGQLTNLGKKQLYDFGVFLRNRYGPDGSHPLYDGAFKGSETKILSSYADRCLNSAGAVSAGMFPPSASPGQTQVWFDELDWQPVPIRYTERDEDRIITSKKPCPRYDADLQAVYSSSEIQQINQQNQDLYEHLTNHTGQTLASVLDVELLFNTLEIEENRGFVLPEWTKGWYPERMRPLASLSLTLFTRTPSMKKTRSGVLLWDIGTHMQKKTSSPADDSKFYLYSGHDTTLVNMLQSLGVSNDHYKPNFGDAVFVELLESSNGEKHVQVLLRNGTSSDELLPMDLPDCIKPCKVDNFMNLEAVTSPEDWEKQCILN